MGNGLRYRVSDRLVVVELEGTYSGADLLALFGTALAACRAERVLLLVDATRSTADRPMEEVKGLVDGFAEYIPRVERVAVVTASDVHFGLARMAGTMAEESGLHVSPFRDFPTAYAYLGVEEPGLPGPGTGRILPGPVG